MRKFPLLTVLLFLSYQILAQGIITGKVTNAKDGTPLAGASVTIKRGSSVISSPDGSFSIATKKNEETLVFSSVGFFDSSLTARVGSIIQVNLREDVRTLSEVVVTCVGVAT